MSIGAIFSFLLAFLKAVPVLNSWFEQFVAFYTNAAIDRMQKENRDAVRKAVQEYDQRELEKAVGNPNPGEPSGQQGSEIISGPPPGA